MPDSVREVAQKVQHMDDDELEEAYRQVRTSPLDPSNAEFAMRVESERGARRMEREREARDRTDRLEMDRRVAEANARAGIPPLDELDRRLREGAREEGS